MPMLDVSDVLLDPMFCEELTLIRRAQTMTKGRGSTTDTVVDPKPFGVVLPADGGDLERGADAQWGPKVLEVHTPYRIRGASRNGIATEQYQPDRLTWNGGGFICINVDDFSHYGDGFVKADFASYELTDPQPQ